MRPITLELTAFGPFAGREIVDFGGLAAHGLYVVCGPTGSGKSTLFDAMTFALFGELPGERLEHVRSHHADRHTPTAAALVFDAGGQRYRVERRTKHERPKHRGRGTTVEPPTAHLWRVVDGRQLEPIAGRPQEVNARCAQLVGLSASQFQRVILLPQGKWADFLLADTRTRRELLQQLFGTRLFERATELARVRAAALGAQVALDRSVVEHHTANAASATAELAALLGCLDLDLDAMAPLVASAHESASRLDAEAAAARRAYDSAAAAAANWDRRARLRARRLELDGRAAEMTAAQAAVERSRRSAVVAEAHRVAASASARASTADAALATAGERATATAAAIGVIGGPPVGLAVRIAERQAAVSSQRALAGDLADAETNAELLRALAERAVDDLQLLRDKVSSVSARRAALNAELAERAEVADTIADCTATVGAADKVLATRRRLDELDAHAEIAKAKADGSSTALEDLTARFLADVAPELAARLTAGEPCAVCGSTDHPAPATSGPSHAVTRDDVLAATKRRDRDTHAMLDVLTQLGDTRRALGDRVDVPVADLVAAHRAAVAGHRLASAAEADVLRISMESARLDKQISEWHDELPALVEAQAVATARLTSHVESLAALRARVAEPDVVTLDNLLDLVARAARAATTLERVAADAREAAGARRHATEHLDTALAGSGFDDLETALAAHLGDDAVLIANDVERWRGALADTRSRLAALDELELPDDRPEFERLAAAMERSAARSEEASTRQTRLDVRLADAVAARDAAAVAEAAGAERVAAYERSRRVHDTCNGDNRTKVQLETWVLAGELDRVTAAANVHLARMTRHRYSLRRDEPSGVGARRSGLDLVVDDADTGRPRPPSTLSGGEQFQASLALALGLADVVSQGGDGTTGAIHEALFVDEGFGSLDADALDQAVDALIGLHATGRTIGVITHVETMKRQLPVGIEVRRLPAGGSTLD